MEDAHIDELIYEAGPRAGVRPGRGLDPGEPPPAPADDDYPVGRPNAPDQDYDRQHIATAG